MAWCGLLAIPEDELVQGTISLAMAANMKRGRKMATVCQETFDLCQDVKGGLSVESGAKRYQVEFELVLKWLVHHEPERGKKALPFLWNERKASALALECVQTQIWLSIPERLSNTLRLHPQFANSFLTGWITTRRLRIRGHHPAQGL